MGLCETDELIRHSKRRAILVKIIFDFMRKNEIPYIEERASIEDTFNRV